MRDALTERDALHFLADNLPITVKELSIGFFWLIDDFDFAGFLKHCHDYLDMLNLEWDVTSSDSPYHAFENLEKMLNYIEKSKNNLKLVGIKNSTSELLDEFKDKGIKLVEYDSIYKKSDYTGIERCKEMRRYNDYGDNNY